MNFTSFKLFLKSKFKFFLPESKKVLIYDDSNSDFIFTLIKKEQCEILHTRFEEINIPILLMSIFNFNNKKLREKYMRKIAFYDPGNAKFKEIMSNMNVLLSIK